MNRLLIAVVLAAAPLARLVVREAELELALDDRAARDEGIEEFEGRLLVRAVYRGGGQRDEENREGREAADHGRLQSGVHRTSLAGGAARWPCELAGWMLTSSGSACRLA